MLGTVMNFFLDWKVKLTILILAFSSAYLWHLSEVKVAVTKAVAEVELNISKENFKLKERSLDAQIALKESFDNIQKGKDAKIKNLNARVASLTRSLQERPSRPEATGVSFNPGDEKARQGGTGIGLYREDSEFLSGEAARAELIKEELIGCYKAYDEAKSTLDKFKMDAQNSPRTH